MKKPIGLGAPFLALIAFGLIFNPYFIPHFPKSGWLSLLVSPQALFFISFAVIASFRKLSFSELGIKRSKLFTDISLGISLGLIPAGLTVSIGLILMGLDSKFHFLPRPILGGGPFSNHFDLPTLMMLLFLAPLSEEMFFRGILLPALRESYSARASVILSAVIFMGGHGGFAIGPLLLGLITAPLTLATGSIIPGVLFHSISNAYGPLLISQFPNLYRYLSFFFQ